MDHIERFATRKAAKEEIARMTGWPGAKAVKWDFGPEGIGWVIQVPNGTGDPLYLRESGFVS